MQKKSESDYKIARQGNVKVITKMQGKGKLIHRTTFTQSQLSDP